MPNRACGIIALDSSQKKLNLTFWKPPLKNGGESRYNKSAQVEASMPTKEKGGFHERTVDLITVAGLRLDWKSGGRTRLPSWRAAR